MNTPKPAPDAYSAEPVDPRSPEQLADDVDEIVRSLDVLSGLAPDDVATLAAAARQLRIVAADRRLILSARVCDEFTMSPACPDCNGAGGRYLVQGEHADFDSETCARCAGSGRSR